MLVLFIVNCSESLSVYLFACFVVFRGAFYFASSAGWLLFINSLISFSLVFFFK